jgi:branched-chain amino acid transport system permease protein
VIGTLTMRISGHYLPLSTIAWGLSLYYLFGNLELLGKHDGINGIPPSPSASSASAMGALYLLIWAVVLLALVSVVNLLDSRRPRGACAQGRRHARGHGRRYGPAEDRHLRLRGRAGGHLGLAVRAPAAGGQSHALRPQYGIEYLLMAVVGGAGHVGARSSVRACWRC